MNRSLHGNRNHPHIALTLHALAEVSQQAGDLKQAKQFFHESLQMQRALHGDRDHPDIAAMLHAPGQEFSQSSRGNEGLVSHWGPKLTRSWFWCMGRGIMWVCCYSSCTRPSEPAGWRSQASEAVR